MTKKQTYEEIRAELISEIEELQYSSDSASKVGPIMKAFNQRMVEAALLKFDKAVEDKKRQLELGELADKFFQRIKLND